MRVLVANNTSNVISLMSGQALQPGGSVTVEIEDEIYDLIQSDGSPDNLGKEDLKKYYEAKEIFDLQTAGSVAVSNVSSGGNFMYIDTQMAGTDELYLAIPVDCEIVALGVIVDTSASDDPGKVELEREDVSELIATLDVPNALTAGENVYTEDIVMSQAELDAWSQIKITVTDSTLVCRPIIVYRERV